MKERIKRFFEDHKSTKKFVKVVVLGMIVQGFGVALICRGMLLQGG